MRRIRVVAAVVRRGDAILITRRLDRAERAGQWEFPGGKVERGEAEAEALRREIQEELGCPLEVGRLLLRHRHRYPELEVELAFYAGTLAPGTEPAPLGVAEIAWARVGTLAERDFLEADRAVLGELERASGPGGEGAEAGGLGPVLLLPGLFDSGPGHWQTLWMQGRPGLRRVEQDDWEAPRLGDWVARLDEAVREVGSQALLAAHSAGCGLVAHWARAHPRPIRGALLVAPSDAEAPSYPKGPTGFAPMPLLRLPFPSTVVASGDDPYVSLARAREFAAAWGSRLVELGAAGHVNTASGHGPWPEGLVLLGELATRT
ncbi:MAG TPA: alpha/beta hydrolase [Anaeromyxobacter sp.]|nr:alpha/beta hydrolase [Anaeromyxobacter sp.]